MKVSIDSKKLFSPGGTEINKKDQGSRNSRDIIDNYLVVLKEA
jgi:hypothetical protein